MKYMNLLLEAPAFARDIDTAAPRSAFAVPGGILVGLAIVALIIAFIVVSVMRGKLKTASRQASANNYIREGSFDLRVRQDYFLYKTVSRRKIEQKKD